jgi:acyl carrier protein
MEKIKSLLATFLGVEETDINDDDSLKEDLHMSPSDIIDFVHVLKENGLEIDETQLGETETVEELSENVSPNEKPV